ncbi:MAG TPA: hypothetical protein VJ899_12065, partial [Salegentibacter sp.]|nr:hypothetical protein [Salegentibacter sp.]
NVILQLARLYEALNILTAKIRQVDRPPEQELKPLIIAFENYFETISEVTHISLSTLGSNPQEIVLNAWNGKDFNRLTSKLDGISNSIIKYSQQHRAYPVIHYFHNNKVKNNVILQLARLYEALNILTDKIRQVDRPPEQELKPLIIAFENYFETISEVTHISLMDNDPPAADIRKLIEESLVEEDSEGLSKEFEFRRFFYTLIHQDGWNWEDIDTKNS